MLQVFYLIEIVNENPVLLPAEVALQSEAGGSSFRYSILWRGIVFPHG